MTGMMLLRYAKVSRLKSTSSESLPAFRFFKRVIFIRIETGNSWERKSSEEEVLSWLRFSFPENKAVNKNNTYINYFGNLKDVRITV